MAKEDVDFSETEKRESLDLSLFPRISDTMRFTDQNRMMSIFGASEWYDAVMNSWNNKYYEFIGWTPATGKFAREHKDILVLFRRKRDNVEYWYHSESETLLALQELGNLKKR